MNSFKSFSNAYYKLIKAIGILSRSKSVDSMNDAFIVCLDELFNLLNIKEDQIRKELDPCEKQVTESK